MHINSKRYAREVKLLTLMRKSNPVAIETQALTLMTHSSSQLLDIELHLEEADYE